MGILADSLRATLDALKQEQEQSQARIQATIDRCNALIDSLKDDEEGDG